MGFKGWSSRQGLPKSRLVNDNGFGDFIQADKVGNDVKRIDKRSVRGAVKQTIDNIQFDSKIEGITYQNLKMLQIPFELKKSYTLLPGFVYNSEKVRPWTYELDFFLDLHGVDIILEVKGFSDAKFAYKLKMLKHQLSLNPRPSCIVFLHLQRETEDFFFLLDQFYKTANPLYLDTLKERFSNPDTEATLKRKAKKRKEYADKRKQKKHEKADTI